MSEDTSAARIATAPLPELRRVLAVKVIDRPDPVASIAPGQIVLLPAEVAAEAIKDGRAKDPDVADKPAAKAKD